MTPPPSPIGLEAAELDRIAEGLRELTVEQHFDRRALEGLGAIVVLRELAEAAAALPPSPVEGWKPDREAVARVIATCASIEHVGASAIQEAATVYREACAAHHEASMTRIIGDEASTAHAFALADAAKERAAELLKLARGDRS